MSETTKDGLTDEMLLKVFERFVALACKSVQLQAQLTKVTRELTAERHAHNVCSEGQQLIIDKLNQTEAALAPLRAVVEDLRSWLFEQFDVFKSRDSITARAIAASFKDVIVKLDALSALPADPSAPAQLVSVTRAQAEQRLTDEFLANLYDFVDMTEFVRALPEMKQDILTVLFVQSAPTPR